MKKLIALVLAFMVCTAYSQSKKIPANNTPSIKAVIEKVAMDYYRDFENVKGDTVNQNPGIIQFESKMVPPGALNTSITKYVNPFSYTWQATMFESEDFTASVAKYKEYYRQLNNTTLTFYDKSSYKLSGVYDIPSESKPFASSILHLDGKNRDLSLFKIEIAMVYTMPLWAVKVFVYEKMADKDVRPTPKMIP